MIITRLVARKQTLRNYLLLHTKHTYHGTGESVLHRPSTTQRQTYTSIQRTSESQKLDIKALQNKRNCIIGPGSINLHVERLLLLYVKCSHPCLRGKSLYKFEDEIQIQYYVVVVASHQIKVAISRITITSVLG